MNIFDTIIGAVSNNTQGTGSLQDLLGSLSKNPQILELATSLLSNDGGAGGLNGLQEKFQQAGLGDLIGSWIGSGQNQSISADQLSTALGKDTLSGMAGNLGLNQADMADQLSSILPGLIDRLTPAGQAPAAGLGNAGDLMGALGSLLKG